MNDHEVQLPRSAVIEAALRLTTERLATELASPAPQAPDWNEFEWRTAISVSVMHGISAVLAGRLRWTGPPLWRAFLDEQAEQGRLRERKVRALLARLHEAAIQRHVPALMLKGSALLELGLYAAGERPQSDIDLLVRPEDFEATHQLIMDAGYVVGVTSRRHRDYLPQHAGVDRAFGEHADNPVKIELHTELLERLPVREIAITAQVFPPHARPGLNGYSGNAALMRHLLLHAAGNLCSHGIRLIQLHDIWRLAKRLDAADWDEALASASDGLVTWWAVPVLALAQQLFPEHWPHAAMARAFGAARAACPARLQRAAMLNRIDKVSLSKLCIPMLPGLAWSHSLAEALRYARLRVHPGREAARQSRRVAAGVHAFSGAAWSRRPGWQKALRFVLGAQPRVATLYSLRRAHAYEPAHNNSA